MFIWSLSVCSNEQLCGMDRRHELVFVLDLLSPATWLERYVFLRIWPLTYLLLKFGLKNVEVCRSCRVLFFKITKYCNLNISEYFHWLTGVHRSHQLLFPRSFGLTDEGIDVRIRGLKIKSSCERDLGLNADVFQSSNLVRFPRLQGNSPDMLYRRTLVIQR